MRRNLIIIGGGFLQVPLIQTVRDMGIAPIVFDMSGDAPGMALAERTVLMSTRDIDGCVREARKLRELRTIHGVLTAGTDASRAVAAIAGTLDLPGIRYADAEAASNKVLMRKRLRQHGVPVPAFYSVWSLKEAREAMDELQFPLVLKPADNMGARGVIKVNTREEIYAAFRHAKKNSPTGEMILEEFMRGPELSVDALAWNQGESFRMTGIADRIIDREPYFVELGHNMPSALPPAVLEEAERVMAAAMRALGIHTGAGKGDLKVTPEGVKVGEVAARLSGGFMSSHTYPYHSGVNLLRAAVQIALGEEPDALEPTRNRVAIERGILSRPGKILSFSGEAAMKKVPGVELVVFSRQPGDVIPVATSNIDKAGHVLATGDSLAQAEAAAGQALALLELEVDDAFSVDWKQVEERARARFTDRICWVCKSCDGENCASGVPGMGGTGRMSTFQDNAKALGEYRIVPRYIRESVQVDSTIELFGRKFEHPIFAAPMTGAVTNLQGAIEEFEFARILLEGSRQHGSLGWVGDGASPEKYKTILEALETVDGLGVAIFKPRADSDALVRRFQEAEARGVLAVGMDIDAISFKTMQLRGQATIARGFDAIRALRDRTRLPFVLKGVLSSEDAELAIAAGVDAIVVSNHGGRVLDDMPGTARVLAGIASTVNKRVPLLVDGGVRSGQDAFKMLALGADAVLVGRTLAIAAVGGGVSAVKFLYSQYAGELRKSMNLCGAANLAEIRADHILRTKNSNETVHSSQD
ncbi:MAG: alpha-hydroxy-acid oxidizing protein [Leptospirales bacterium]|jgi:isopentenyl diphosphate isomerase/L-lactate dehydrogenase-like FMN-dependent dehydrogenase/biotin carboxylase